MKPELPWFFDRIMPWLFLCGPLRLCGSNSHFQMRRPCFALVLAVRTLAAAVRDAFTALETNALKDSDFFSTKGANYHSLGQRPR
jgi:hypothetical protein